MVDRLRWSQDVSSIYVRGLDSLQGLLDLLPPESPMCRDAWCGRWERSGGVYEPHPDHSDGNPDA